MAALKDIKRRIKSVNNTQKTTSAMKLVSTVKLKRSQEVATQSRAYSQKLNEMLSTIARQIETYRIGGIESRYFATQDEKVEKIDLIFVTADKGLCGGFNYRTIKTISQKLEECRENKIKVRMRGIGKKGVEYFKFNRVELYDETVGLSSAPNFEKAKEHIAKSVGDYMKGLTDRVILIYNGFRNMISQEMREILLLPIDINRVEPIEESSIIEFEPKGDETILNTLVERYVEFNLYYALIDSLAAEHSARMQAMENATKNAKELARTLTLQYNKARQEAITTELSEIVSGAEAMK
ncbi:MAG: F0F1 ATP synthase subunit gamma [Helicobacteraceae bacterium]|jgi:F-type H+-transporting ATPase subunit gamma|nr:F0F1 ATP synthase subunit gamma [Helicobacteraceae bacterium]